MALFSLNQIDNYIQTYGISNQKTEFNTLKKQFRETYQEISDRQLAYYGQMNIAMAAPILVDIIFDWLLAYNLPPATRTLLLATSIYFLGPYVSESHQRALQTSGDIANSIMNEAIIKCEMNLDKRNIPHFMKAVSQTINNEKSTLKWQKFGSIANPLAAATLSTMSYLAWDKIQLLGWSIPRVYGDEPPLYDKYHQDALYSPHGGVNILLVGFLLIFKFDVNSSTKHAS